MHDSSLAPVVQKLDNAIQGINHYLVHSAIMVLLILIHWIVIWGL